MMLYGLALLPSIVSKFFSNLFLNETLTLELLSKKLVVLLAIVTAYRIHTLSLICIDDITISSDSISIKIPRLIKTSGPNRIQPNLTLRFFQRKYKKKKSCHYFAMFRKLLLFVVFSPTINRWVEQTLASSGVGTSIFTSHSTRHASTSKVCDGGVNIESSKFDCEFFHLRTFL